MAAFLFHDCRQLRTSVRDKYVSYLDSLPPVQPYPGEEENGKKSTGQRISYTNSLKFNSAADIFAGNFRATLPGPYLEN